MDYKKLNELIDWTLASGKLIHMSNLPYTFGEISIKDNADPIVLNSVSGKVQITNLVLVFTNLKGKKNDN